MACKNNTTTQFVRNFNIPGRTRHFGDDGEDESSVSDSDGDPEVTVPNKGCKDSGNVIQIAIFDWAEDPTRFGDAFTSGGHLVC